MWIGILGLNGLCFASALLGLRRLLRPALEADSREGFARVLAAAIPLARHLMAGGDCGDRVGAVPATAPGLHGRREAKTC